MCEISLRNLTRADRTYFSKWWRDKTLLRLTSGNSRRISDREVDTYFEKMLQTKTDFHFLVVRGRDVIGHATLVKRRGGWYETQIIIGEKRNWGKGYGADAIRQLVARAKRNGITNIFLEVRPENLRAIRAYEKSGFRKAGMKYYPANTHLPQTVRMVLRH